VIATVSERSGPPTESRFLPLPAFGAMWIPPNGTLASTGVTVTGAIGAVQEITVRVTFIDDHGNTGSVGTTTGVRADLTGEWAGTSNTRQPPGDWSALHVTLTQRDDALTGSLITRDERRFPLNGVMPRSDPPYVVVGGLPTVSFLPCGLSVLFENLEFSSGQVQRLSGRLTGKCPGTAFGVVDLRRTP
jgi:hypothetical protein